MRSLIPVILSMLAALPATGYADIYQYVDEEGTVCFTDAPRNGKAALIMKEQSAPRPSTSRHRTLPKHLTATGIAEKAGPEVSVTPSAPSPHTSLPVSGRITSLVGLRHDPFDGTMREHNGVDIAVPQGTPVRAVAPGRVLFAGTRPGYGNMVVVEHGDGTMTLYAHNSTNLVAEGETVAESTSIALSGSTGRSTGPHLHFEAWKDGVNITSSYIPAGKGETTGAVGGPRSATGVIRRIVQADGTIYFSDH
ncbi:peptidoglycan DD-metalloendopeptidase family protein [Geobacter sp.]|uniref:peptidoglycan DD-metalloendopeptidase family protein n=1 Tax=Geobacter sp. TaxID=46610 RepID=UPI002609392F|nr:peptidoglycan DD-metalloendopeptidase family protein [Geobacter sp.]